MNNSAQNPWKVITEKDVYENQWIKVTHHEVKTPSGNDGIYGLVHFKNYAIGILVLDEDYNTWIVGQYRFPIKQYTWEIPEGGGLIRKNPLQSAKRELREETGIEAEEWRLIQTMQLSNSATDEVAFLYLAQKLSFHKPQPDDTEELEQKKIPFDELYEMVNSGKINDSLTVAAVLKVKIMMIEGKL